jgi:cytochrome b involved in lipid metabolism
MLSRQALHRLKPNLARVAARSLATQAAPKAGSKAASDDGILWKAGLLGLLASAGVTTMEAQRLTPMERPPINKEDLNHPPARPDLPTFSLEDVAEHCEESSLWYTFRGAVYDMTFFLHGHPGGEPVSFSTRQ